MGFLKEPFLAVISYLIILFALLKLFSLINSILPANDPKPPAVAIALLRDIPFGRI